MASVTHSSPFPPQHALSKELLQDQHVVSQTQTASSTQITYVPGQPSVSLTPTEVHDFLMRELQTSVLDELYPRLIWVGRKDGENVEPLNSQKVKGPEIVPAEDPKLHLVWQHNKIYIKPVPVCLFNYEFWQTYLALSPNPSAPYSRSSARSLAMGFMRSYAHLIQHQLDFMLAQENHLLPNHLEWNEWSIFIAHFRRIGDEHVARRYHYGQLRLSRLNWAVRLFQPPSAPSFWFYEIRHWSTALYLQDVIGPLIFTFASLSIVLSSMQVVLSVPSDGLWSDRSDTSGMQAMRQAFWVFSIITLFFCGVIWTLMLVIPASVLIWQLQWGLRNRGVPRSKQLR